VKRLSILLIFLVSGINLFSQKQFTIEDLSNMVVGIQDRFGADSILLGTATIISDSTRYFLATASHVTNEVRGDCNLVFRGQNDTPVFVPLKQFLGQKLVKWINHYEADISIIELIPFDEPSKERLTKWSFPFSQIMDSKQAIIREVNVITIGFPVVTKIRQHFSPLTFNSFFSSGLITLDRADTKKPSIFQLLENPSVQGYSGGPVLIGISRPGATLGPSHTVFVGMVHGTFNDNTGGKLAMITPAFYLSEMIKKL